jgi:hypothetical protein
MGAAKAHILSQINSDLRGRIRPRGTKDQEKRPSDNLEGNGTEKVEKRTSVSLRGDPNQGRNMRLSPPSRRNPLWTPENPVPT